jgi:hypothetical protein
MTVDATIGKKSVFIFVGKPRDSHRNHTLRIQRQARAPTASPTCFALVSGDATGCKARSFSSHLGQENALETIYSDFRRRGDDRRHPVFLRLAALGFHPMAGAPRRTSNPTESQ